MDTPQGELVIKTLAMPADTNANGDIFGGWLLSQMDMGGAMLAYTIAQHRLTTVAVDKMKFLLPVTVGDAVSCYASIARKGNTSVTINVQVWVSKRDLKVKPRLVTEGLFTYVSIDEKGRPTPIIWD